MVDSGESGCEGSSDGSDENNNQQVYIYASDVLSHLVHLYSS